MSRNGFYGWRNRKPSKQQLQRAEVSEKAEAFFRRAKFKYGYRKVHQDIVLETEITCCKETVRRVLTEKGLFFKGKRRFVVTTDSDHHQPVAENILDRDFTSEAPDRKWSADISVPQQAA